MDFNITYMAQRHIKAITDLEKSCFSRAWSHEALASELKNTNARFLVALKGGEVLGYIGCIFVCGEGSITNVAVSPEFRRQGIGNALLSSLIACARKENIESLFLEVRRSNSSAQALYKKHGFVITGIRRSFYRDPTEDAYIMQLSLNQTHG